MFTLLASLITGLHKNNPHIRACRLVPQINFEFSRDMKLIDQSFSPSVLHSCVRIDDIIQTCGIFSARVSASFPCVKRPWRPFLVEREENETLMFLFSPEEVCTVL